MSFDDLVLSIAVIFSNNHDSAIFALAFMSGLITINAINELFTKKEQTTVWLVLLYEDPYPFALYPYEKRVSCKDYLSNEDDLAYMYPRHLNAAYKHCLKSFVLLYLIYYITLKNLICRWNQALATLRSAFTQDSNDFLLNTKGMGGLNAVFPKTTFIFVKHAPLVVRFKRAPPSISLFLSKQSTLLIGSMLKLYHKANVFILTITSVCSKALHSVESQRVACADVGAGAGVGAGFIPYDALELPAESYSAFSHESAKELTMAKAHAEKHSLAGAHGNACEANQERNESSGVEISKDAYHRRSYFSHGYELNDNQDNSLALGDAESNLKSLFPATAYIRRRTITNRTSELSSTPANVPEHCDDTSHPQGTAQIPSSTAKVEGVAAPAPKEAPACITASECTLDSQCSATQPSHASQPICTTQSSFATQHSAQALPSHSALHRAEVPASYEAQPDHATLQRSEARIMNALATTGSIEDMQRAIAVTKAAPIRLKVEPPKDSNSKSLIDMLEAKLLHRQSDSMLKSSTAPIEPMPAYDRAPHTLQKPAASLERTMYVSPYPTKMAKDVSDASLNARFDFGHTHGAYVTQESSRSHDLNHDFAKGYGPNFDQCHSNNFGQDHGNDRGNGLFKTFSNNFMKWVNSAFQQREKPYKAIAHSEHESESCMSKESMEGNVSHLIIGPKTDVSSIDDDPISYNAAKYDPTEDEVDWDEDDDYNAEHDAYSLKAAVLPPAGILPNSFMLPHNLSVLEMSRRSDNKTLSKKKIAANEQPPKAKVAP